MNNLVGQVFGVPVGYVGSVMSNLAKMNMRGVTEDINEQHMTPWAEMCAAAKIENTPLSPYLDQELLYNNSTAVNGSAIEATGYSYNHPTVTTEVILPRLNLCLLGASALICTPMFHCRRYGNACSTTLISSFSQKDI